MNNYIPELIVKGRRVIHKNFEGRQTEYNRAGDRNFSAVLENIEGCEPYDIEAIRAYGWNIRELPPRPDIPDSQPLFYIPVRVDMDAKFPPKIYLVTSGGKTQLIGDNVKVLDHSDIKAVAMTIRPYKWERNGKSGVKAYLKNMFVTLNEDPLEREFSDIPTIGGEVLDELIVEENDAADAIYGNIQ